MLLEETADGILRSDPSQKPFNLPLFRPAQAVELSPLPVVEYQTRPCFDPECHGIPGEHLTRAHPYDIQTRQARGTGRVGAATGLLTTASPGNRKNS